MRATCGSLNTLSVSVRLDHDVATVTAVGTGDKLKFTSAKAATGGGKDRYVLYFSIWYPDVPHQLPRS